MNAWSTVEAWRFSAAKSVPIKRGFKPPFYSRVRASSAYALRNHVRSRRR
jgi:hypothetical protein